MRYRILGPLEVQDGARDVPLGRGRQRLLLAVLLLHRNRALSSDRLIDALWGESPPPTAARSLHNHVSALRKALGVGALVTRGHGYELRVGDDELDAQRFAELTERGRAALEQGASKDARVCCARRSISGVEKRWRTWRTRRPCRRMRRG
jgi:DNA-binding SARP family transcriptional activator